MLESLRLGDNAWLICESSGQMIAGSDAPRVLFPGSFNPLHEGHTSLAQLASQRLQLPLAFELSIANVDKPDLCDEEVHRRLEQFRGTAPVVVTRAATFVAKALLFPGSVFVVGADTAVRIVEPRYYGNEHTRMAEALESIRTAGCQFLVGGRVDRAGRFIEGKEVAIPEAYRDLFMSISEEEFRMDISSTEIRSR